jgi:nitrogen regulatory protein P-II 1
MMKKIEAIVRPDKLSEIKDGLAKYGIKGMTVSDVSGCGLQKGYTGIYRGKEYDITLLPKVKLEIVVVADIVEDVVAVIIACGQTGKIGDGKIFILPVDQAFRIRTDESGKYAL